MVTAAHAKGLKVLFDYAMVHVHTESDVYKQHQSDSPAWFTPNCICGAAGCGNYDTSCWFAPYLPDLSWTTQSATARASVAGPLGIQPFHRWDVRIKVRAQTRLPRRKGRRGPERERPPKSLPRGLLPVRQLA